MSGGEGVLRCAQELMARRCARALMSLRFAWELLALRALHV